MSKNDRFWVGFGSILGRFLNDFDLFLAGFGRFWVRQREVPETGFLWKMGTRIIGPALVLTLA